MVDWDKLPRESTLQKAAFRRPANGELVFGMLHTRGTEGGRILALEEPDVDHVLQTLSNVTLLEDLGQVEREAISISDTTGQAQFVSVVFSIPHEFKVMRSPQLVPLGVGYLLSGFWQLGQQITLHNYLRYTRTRNLKFLPFLIDRNHLRFFVYRPTPDNVMATLRMMIEVMKTLSVFESCDDHYDFVGRSEETCTNAYLRDIAAVIHLLLAEKVTPFSINKKMVADALLATQGRLKSMKGLMSYVLKDLKGPQAATVFTYDMYEKR